MNERIKELKRQATIEHPIGHGIVKYEFSPEKFAELIVRECVAVCMSRSGNNDYNVSRLHCVADIKQHFGVEE